MLTSAPLPLFVRIVVAVLLSQQATAASLSKFPSLHFACNGTGFENTTQLKQDSKYHTVIFEFRHKYKDPPYDHEEQVLATQTKMLYATHNKSAFVYRNHDMGSMFALQRKVMYDSTRSDWFTGPPQPAIFDGVPFSWRSVNFSNPKASNFYSDVITTEVIHEGPSTAGIFWDEMDANVCVNDTAGAAMWTPTINTFRKSCQLLASHGKQCMLSIVNVISQLSSLSIGPSPACPFPEERFVQDIGVDLPWTRYYEHWFNGFTSRQPNNDAAMCAGMITNAAWETARGIPIAARAPGSHSKYRTKLDMAVGGFLIAAGKGSSFGFSDCWFDACVSWQSEFYNRDIGDPISSPTGTQKDPTTGLFMHWKRNWQGVEVELDCRKQTVSFDWKTEESSARAATPDIDIHHTGSISIGRTNGVGVAVEPDVLLFAGGYTDSKGQNKSARIDLYNTTSNSWYTHDMKLGRTLFAGTSLGNLAMFGCGESGVNVHSSETDSVEVWHADTNTWTNMKLSQARKKCSATSVVLSRTKDKDSNNVLEGKIIFAGGWPKNGHAPTSVVDIYDYKSKVWTVAQLSQARMYMSAASAGNIAVFAGGLAPGGDVATVDVYDASTNQWRVGAPIAVPIREGAATSTNHWILLYGGNHVSMYHPVKNEWRQRNSSAEWAKMATATIGSDSTDRRFALFAGGIGCPGNDCNVVEAFDDVEERWFMVKKNLTVSRSYLMGAGVGPVAAFAGGSNDKKVSVTTTDFITLEELN